MSKHIRNCPKTSENAQTRAKIKKKFENFRNFPEASKRVRSHRNASECIRTCPNMSKRVQKLARMYENAKQLAKNHENSKKFRGIFREAPLTRLGGVLWLLPNASYRITHPNASERVRTYPYMSESFRERTKTLKKNYENAKKFRGILREAP